jgi:hypothetical protein
MLNQKTHFLADVNDRLLHYDGDMSRYFIDKEQKSCLDTDEDCRHFLTNAYSFMK